MSDWISALQDFAQSIRSGSALPATVAECTRYPLERGVEVYRNNYRGNLQDALAGAYPVLQQLVGEAFFRRVAREHIERHPPCNGNLHSYGGEMERLLAAHDAVQQLPYLAEVARLEWAWHRAYFADDVAPFALERLARIPQQHYGALRWRLHPAVALLETRYPVAAIWEAHQPGMPRDFDIDLSAGGERLLVFRSADGIVIQPLDRTQYRWLDSLQRGMTLQQATDLAMAEQADFDLASSLGHWLSQAVLYDFELAELEA